MPHDIQKLYNISPHYIIGFHGCDKETADNVICKNEILLPSQNDYDWLGHGQYFWENDYFRALEFANFLKENPKRSKLKIKNPAVIGAVICLGNCLDLTKRDSISLLKRTYEIYRQSAESNKFEIPKNEKGSKNDMDFLKRNLDCAVIEYFISAMKKDNNANYDSVRGVFIEGQEIYENAGFKDKTHIQICIKNPNCIKGYFYPRKMDNKFNLI